MVLVIRSKVRIVQAPRNGRFRPTMVRPPTQRQSPRHQVCEAPYQCSSRSLASRPNNRHRNCCLFLQNLSFFFYTTPDRTYSLLDTFAFYSMIDFSFHIYLSYSRFSLSQNTFFNFCEYFFFFTTTTNTIHSTRKKRLQGKLIKRKKEKRKM